MARGTLGTKTATTAAPTSGAALLLLAANAGRQRAVLCNAGNVTVYIGPTSGVTTANGVPLLPGDTVDDDYSTDAWYGITASGTGDIRIIETAS